MRPVDAGGHGEEVVAGLLGDSTGFDPLAETLVSTEYGRDGLPGRVGLELYRDGGAVTPWPGRAAPRRLLQRGRPLLDSSSPPEELRNGDREGAARWTSRCPP